MPLRCRVVEQNAAVRRLGKAAAVRVVASQRQYLLDLCWSVYRGELVVFDWAFTGERRC